MLRVLTVHILAGWLLGGTALAGDWGKATTTEWGKEGATASAGKRLSVAAPVMVGDLALYPVLDREASGRPEFDGTALGPAMASRMLVVREAGDGQIDRLVFTNRGDDPVVVMAGDVVQGGMQDRVVQRSLLVAGGTTVRVPVQCVERSRWTDRDDGRFVYAGRVDPGLRTIVLGAASQEATWSAVAARNRQMGVDQNASWLAGRPLDPGLLAQAEAELRERFEGDKRVVGVVVARGGQFTSSEVYPHPDLFAMDRMQVLSSHLSVAPARRGGLVAAKPSIGDAAAYLEEQLDD